MNVHDTKLEWGPIEPLSPSPRSTVVTRADAEANALWEQRAMLRKPLLRLRADLVRLTKLLPWWAAPGYSGIKADGSLCDAFVWYPAMTGIPLPSGVGWKIIRRLPSQIEPRTWYDMTKQQKKQEDDRVAAERAKIEALLAAQNVEEGKVGLTNVKKAIQELQFQGWDIAARLRLLMAHSPAALAATLINDFLDAIWGSERTITEHCFVALGVLTQCRPATRGLLRCDVDRLLAHPGTLRKNFDTMRVPYLIGFRPELYKPTAVTQAPVGDFLPSIYIMNSAGQLVPREQPLPKQKAAA